jgi:hypothetical protein
LKTLKQFSAVKYENLLIKHLSLGGNVRDATGKQLVGQQVLAVWNEKGIQDICAHSVTMDDFCKIYAACIEALMPNPCILLGQSSKRVMLVPSIFLFEEWRIRESFGLIAKHTADLSTEPKIAAYTEAMVEIARQIKTVHDTARGPAPFQVTPKGGLPLSAVDPVQRQHGCGCMALILLFLIGLIIWWIVKAQH